MSREAPVQFGYGLGVERFKRFQFSVPAIPLQKRVFMCFSGFGSWKTVPAVPVPLSVRGFPTPKELF